MEATVRWRYKTYYWTEVRVCCCRAERNVRGYNKFWNHWENLRGLRDIQIAKDFKRIWEAWGELKWQLILRVFKRLERDSNYKRFWKKLKNYRDQEALKGPRACVRNWINWERRVALQFLWTLRPILRLRNLYVRGHNLNWKRDNIVARYFLKFLSNFVSLLQKPWPIQQKSNPKLLRDSVVLVALWASFCNRNLLYKICWTGHV